ncbi:transposase [Butyrivibrio sp. NC3005]|uniref:transposase n=1 Tax=Butyrivibrio sp. NC3005 TaxID=1280685 RepID=UPI003FA42A11
MYLIDEYTTLESNKLFKLNFDEGDLSSDADLLLIKEFISKLHFDKLIGSIFHTNGFSGHMTHKDDENLLKVIYQIFSSYYEDNCANELTDDSIFRQTRR